MVKSRKFNKVFEAGRESAFRQVIEVAKAMINRDMNRETLSEAPPLDIDIADLGLVTETVATLKAKSVTSPRHIYAYGLATDLHLEGIYVPASLGVLSVEGMDEESVAKLRDRLVELGYPDIYQFGLDRA